MLSTSENQSPQCLQVKANTYNFTHKPIRHITEHGCHVLSRTLHLTSELLHHEPLQLSNIFKFSQSWLKRGIFSLRKISIFQNFFLKRNSPLPLPPVVLETSYKWRFQNVIYFPGQAISYRETDTNIHFSQQLWRLTGSAAHHADCQGLSIPGLSYCQASSGIHNTVGKEAVATMFLQIHVRYHIGMN